MRPARQGVLHSILPQVSACLADVLTVEDPAGECALNLQGIDQGSVGAILDIETPIQTDVWRPRA